MSATRGRSLTRLLSMVEALRAARRGLTVTQLIERTGGSRASTYRDLNVLRSVGLPIDKLPIAGEMRHVLATDSTATQVTPLQLVTGRRALSLLEGTRLVRELDGLMRQAGPRRRSVLRLYVPLSHAVAPAHLTIIDRALDQGKCVRGVADVETRTTYFEQAHRVGRARRVDPRAAARWKRRSRWQMATQLQEKRRDDV